MSDYDDNFVRGIRMTLNIFVSNGMYQCSYKKKSNVIYTDT